MRWTFRATAMPDGASAARWSSRDGGSTPSHLSDGDRRWQAVLEVDGPRGSPSWWLANAYGFLVDDDAGGPVGVVDDIRLDPGTGRPSALIVVQGWGRSRTVIPIDAVTEIAPDDRWLTVVRGDYPPA